MKRSGPILRTGLTTLGVAAALTALASASPASIQAQEADGRWLAWTGCWETSGELADGSMLCVRPVPDGVEMLTIEGAEVVSTEVVRADGLPHPIEQEGCSGSRVADFGTEGRRIYVEEEYVCDGLAQRSTGMIAMISPTEWIDIRAAETDGEAATWVRSYRIASPEAAEEAGFAGLNVGREIPVRMARARAASADLGDVMEASSRAHPDVVSAWLVESGERFDVSADRLVELADAGVPPEVIDVVVASSFPDRFVLGDERPEERVAERRGSLGYGYHDPYFYGRWGFRYGYDSFYSPYYSFGYYRPYRRSVIIVRERDPNPGGGGSFGRGRVVKGQGYTRGSSGSSGGSAVRGSTGSSSRGGSTGSTGRKAKPRGSGGTGGGGGGGGGTGGGGGGLLY